MTNCQVASHNLRVDPDDIGPARLQFHRQYTGSSVFQVMHLVHIHLRKGLLGRGEEEVSGPGRIGSLSRHQ